MLSVEQECNVSVSVEHEVDSVLGIRDVHCTCGGLTQAFGVQECVLEFVHARGQ